MPCKEIALENYFVRSCVRSPLRARFSRVCPALFPNSYESFDHRRRSGWGSPGILRPVHTATLETGKLFQAVSKLLEGDGLLSAVDRRGFQYKAISDDDQERVAPVPCVALILTLIGCWNA